MASLFDAVERPRVIINTNDFDKPKSLADNIEREPEVIDGIPDHHKNILQSTVDKLFGLHGEERYQLWPERLVRDAVSAPHDVMTGQIPTHEVDPVTGEVHTSSGLIKAAQDISALAGTGGLAGAGNETGMALGSGPILKSVMPEIKPFYSAVENAIAAAKQPKADAQQWLSFLKNQPGVKQEELAHLGLDKLSGSITKDDLLKAVQEGQPQIKEVIKGGKVKPTLDQQIEAQESIARDYPDLHPESSEYQKLVNYYANDIAKDSNPTKYHSYQLPGGPLSRDTEILTNKGWKRIDSIEVGDVVMTRQDEGGILEWQPVQAAPKVYAENLYHFFNQSIDMRVTENHQMVVKKRRRNKKGIFRTTARELWKMSECVVPLTGVWTGKGSQTLFGFNANDIAEFVGWYLSEGSYKRVGEKKNTIQIAQCKNYNPEKCERLEALFTRLGLVWKYYGGTYGIGVKTMNKELKDLLHNQPKSDGKYVPDFFFNESKSVIRSLLDGLILGDGCSTKVEKGRLEKINYFTNSVRLAGDVQALILMIGKRASVRQRPSGLYCVGINHKEWSSVDDAKYEIASYNDFAYCVTVENHSIYVRRNGVAAFTGNSNYREMLLTLPNKNTQEIALGDQAAELAKSLRQEYGEQWFMKAPKEQVDKYKNLIDQSVGATDSVPTYKSSHWDEPNVLAHIRMNDRNIDGKKSLHLEEIQSDWHQEGRKKGYKTPVSTELQNSVDKIVSEKLQPNAKFLPAQVVHTGGKVDINSATPNQIGFWQNQGVITSKEADILREHNKLNNNFNAVPDAPFKKTWDELALKKAITHAVKNGYDSISWTPGEAQAARYDLSKQVDSIKYLKNDDGTYNIVPFKNNSPVHSVEGENIKPEKLADIVGKEVAEKIVKGDGNREAGTSDIRVLSGQDLKVGGQGMKAFYDKMLVDKMNALTKKYGGKVEQSEVETHRGYPEKLSVYDKDGHHVKDFKTMAEARTYLADPANGVKGGSIKGNKAVAPKTDPVHVLKITPELREHVLKNGFPLFSAGVPVFSPVDHDPFKSKEK